MASYQSQSQHENGLEKKKAPISNKNKYGFTGSIIVYFIATMFIIYKDKEKRDIFLKLVNDKNFVLGLGFVVSFILYTLNLADDDEETEKVKKATRAGLIALLIAIMAALDLKLAPFWLVWLTSYYLDISG